MSAEQDEANNPFGYYPDLFAEPHDHANMWDISAFWDELDDEADDETTEQPVGE